MLLGNGDGSFQLPQSFPTQPGPHSLAVADFNGDGLPDVALSNSTSSVSIVLGNGDGTFQPPVDFPSGPNPRLITAGRLRGPTMPEDLVMASSSNISALLGNGDGTFQSPQQSYAGSIDSLALGDFNNDDLLDVAVAYGAGRTVSVLLGNGDGTFQAPSVFAVGMYPIYLVAGDFNGDGALDLAVADPGGFPTVWLLLGNGDGSFQPARSIFVGSQVRNIPRLAIGDFNGDGLLDLAVLFQVVPIPGLPWLPLVEVLVGNGDGSFRYASGPGGALGSTPGTLVVGKLRGPSAADDLVLTAPDDNEISVALYNPDGSLASVRVFGGSAAGVGDFNSDGRLDLVSPNAGGFSVLFNSTPK